MSGEHHFTFLGDPLTVRLFRLEELEPAAPTVGIVFAEGEDVRSGIKSVLDAKTPDLLVILGGGIAAAVEATETVKSLNFDVSRVLLVGAFLVGGNATTVRAEKRGVLAGFAAEGTPGFATELAASTFPQISIGDGLATALSSVNALVHVPPMIFNAMSVERGDDVRFYVEGFGDSVCRLLVELDEDRLRLGSALGFSLLSIGEMKDTYSGSAAMQAKTLREKFNTSVSTHAVKIPNNFHHRFLAHELRTTFAPMSELAHSLQLDLPTIQSVVRIGEVLLDTDLVRDARPIAQKFLRLLNTRSLV